MIKQQNGAEAEPLKVHENIWSKNNFVYVCVPLNGRHCYISYNLLNYATYSKKVTFILNVKNIQYQRWNYKAALLLYLSTIKVLERWSWHLASYSQCVYFSIKPSLRFIEQVCLPISSKYSNAKTSTIIFITSTLYRRASLNTGDLHYGCVAKKSAATVYCWHVYGDQYFWGIITVLCEIMKN